ncbi:MAG: hypothetical protein PHN49_03695 [Candidatus Omnitrophica bacterium]|nr:hypothetical protein [Candidatus Omnitrophota bacterium]MDD5670722.1 hypothetical protein [Candidatus Omnitrophota bacterium]
MGLETFPEIESFQKLPRQVIVKGGGSRFSSGEGAELRGIVINNIGHAIRDLKVNLVIFNDYKIPVLNTSTVPDSEMLPQGAIANFTFRIEDYSQEITDYYLYANWRFDDRE